MRTAEIEQLKEECEKLRKTVKMLEEGDKLKPARVEQIVIDEASPHEVKGKSKRKSSQLSRSYFLLLSLVLTIRLKHWRKSSEKIAVED